MLKDLIRQVADGAGLEEEAAREAVGVVFTTADRQGACLIEKVFAQVPGARTLAASTAARQEMPAGPIAKLIEQTPGGKRHVALDMFARLHALGLGHMQVSRVVTLIGSWAGATFALSDTALLVDLFESDAPAEPEKGVAVA